MYMTGTLTQLRILNGQLNNYNLPSQMYSVAEFQLHMTIGKPNEVPATERIDLYARY